MTGFEERAHLMKDLDTRIVVQVSREFYTIFAVKCTIVLIVPWKMDIEYGISYSLELIIVFIFRILTPE